jgi:tRNA (cytidine32/guanosine34-2'-O)-methyltransferase
LKNPASLISVDIQPMAPISGVDFIQGDITELATFEKISLTIPENRRSDLVVCDGAPDVTGFHDIDFYIQSQLLVAALNIGLHSLKPNGVFVAKIFRGNHDFFLFSQFKMFFSDVELFKPHSSRESSAEHFIIGRGFNPPEKFALKFVGTFDRFDKGMVEEGGDLGKNKFIFEYLDCGDLGFFDKKQDKHILDQGDLDEMDDVVDEEFC